MMQENNVAIYIASNENIDNKYIEFICNGLEEESIPFKIVKENFSNSKELAEYAYKQSKLDIGIGVDSDGFSCIASGKYLGEKSLFYKKRNSEKEFKILGINSARLLKGIPFTMENE